MMQRTPLTCSVTDSFDNNGTRSYSTDTKRSPNQVHHAKIRVREKTNNQLEECNDSPLNLSELVREIDSQLKHDRSTPLNMRSTIRHLLERYQVNSLELERFAFVDPTKNYTRNLIATDHETYALILLVWNRGKYSPVHDHPCDGCWVKVIDGTINEVQYKQSPTENQLVESSNVTLSEGVTYMDDSIGLHKIGNPRHDCDAITLHLYSPPYDKCRIWFDPSDASKSSIAYSYYFSEFGERADY